MKKVILGLLPVAGSLPAIALTTEKTNDMDRIELCKENYTTLFGGEALNEAKSKTFVKNKLIAEISSALELFAAFPLIAKQD